jgi:hypothetical protein
MRVPPAEKVHRSRFVEVDGMRTHFLEAGDGPTTVVLLQAENSAAAPSSVGNTSFRIWRLTSV